MAHGQMNHLELPADDVARARKFYEGLFGWELSEMPQYPNYFLFRFGPIERSGGAIGIRNESTGSQLRLYISVDSLDESLPRVAELGGKVVEPKTEIQGQGWYAVIDDTEGNQLGLYESLPQPAM
jgi:predicted enzyme related to lactoylglutathione lyase